MNKLAIVKQANMLESKGEILVIAPHADDELIGCNQLIKNAPNRVAIFYCGFLGSNITEDNRRRREAEIIAYASFHRCKLVISEPSLIQSDLKCTMERLNPEYIFLPSYVDWHDEHRLVNELLLKVNPSVSSIVGWYHVSMPIPGPIVSSFSSMTKQEHREKWDTMRKFYSSQSHMDLLRFMYVERLSTVNDSYRETYVIMPMEEFKRKIKSLSHLSPEYFQSLKRTLGNIKQMYTETYKLYSLVELSKITTVPFKLTHTE